MPFAGTYHTGDNMTFWNEELETMPVEELKEMQFRLLQNEIRTMYEKS